MSRLVPYTKPPIVRGVDPTRMNWLWRLICDADGLRASQVHRALVAAGISVTPERVRSWHLREGEDGYVALNMAELERNLRAVIATRHLLGTSPRPPA